tara:strand:- start:45372 stop:47159 length:1788 start_codon:yes stop_codon:yes gene_type:complete
VSLWVEIKRRNVAKVGVAYVTLAWIVIEVTSIAVPALNLSPALNGIVFYLGMIGFPFALFFAWAFEMTPNGIKKTEAINPGESIAKMTGKKLERIIIALLVLTVGVLMWENYGGSPVEQVVTDTPIQIAEPLVEEQAPPSIAVLPFVNMSADQEQEYFSDGISEEILNVLAKIPNLHVTSRSSAFAFKGKDLDLKEVANQLGVNHILEGSVRKAGDQVRITAQLIEANSDRHLWSETYDRELVDIFAVQDEISNAIVIVLKEKLMGEEEVPMQSLVTSTTNPAAYTAYLKGFQLWQNGNSDEDAMIALAAINESIALDDSYAPAHAMHARIYSGMTQIAYYPLSEGAPIARQSIARAIELDPNFAPSYLTRANIRSALAFDFIGAKNDLDKALSLNPNDALVYRQLSQFSSAMGDYDQAILHAQKAVELDPLNIAARVQESRVYTFMGDAQKGLETADLALTLNPDSQSLRMYRALINLRLGKNEDALADAQMLNDEAFNPQIQSMAYYKMGDMAASDEKLNELIDEASDDSAYQIAEVYGIRGDVDKCLEWLETAYEQLDPGLQGVMASPFLGAVKDEPRYQSLLDKMKLKPLD